MTSTWNREKAQVYNLWMAPWKHVSNIIESMQHAILTKIISVNPCSHKRVDGRDVVLTHK